MSIVLALAMLVVSLDPDGTPVDAAPAVSDTDEAPAPAVVLTPHAYLYAAYPSLARRLDCMIQGESSWNPSAVAGPYVGLAQFDYSTWLSTPPGRAGLSRYDPYASIDGMAWGTQHLGWSRWPVTSRRC